MEFTTLEDGTTVEAKQATASVEEQSLVKPQGLFARIRYYEELLDRKLGVESHSLDRVLPENRQPPNTLAMAFIWASATMNLSCFSTGFMGKEFGLSLGQTIPIMICATFLGACLTVRTPFLLLTTATNVALSDLHACFLGLVCHDGPRDWPSSSRHL